MKKRNRSSELEDWEDDPVEVASFGPVPFRIDLENPDARRLVRDTAYRNAFLKQSKEYIAEHPDLQPKRSDVDLSKLDKDLLSGICLQATMLGHEEAAIACLVAGADPDITELGTGRTVLHHAAKQGLFRLLSFALERSQHPDALDNDGYTFGSYLPIHSTWLPPKRGTLQ